MMIAILQNKQTTATVSTTATTVAVERILSYIAVCREIGTRFKTIEHSVISRLKDQGF